MESLTPAQKNYCNSRLPRDLGLQYFNAREVSSFDSEFNAAAFEIRSICVEVHLSADG